MAHSELISHQLIRMLAMRLTKILMQHDTMNNGQRSVNAVYQEEHDVRHILRCHHQAPKRKQDNKRDTYAPHIPREALGLGPEVEDAEHQHPDNRQHQVRRFNERRHVLPDQHTVMPDEIGHLINQRNRDKHRQCVRRRNTIDPIHKIDEVRRSHAEE